MVLLNIHIFHDLHHVIAYHALGSYFQFSINQSKRIYTLISIKADYTATGIL